MDYFTAKWCGSCKATTAICRKLQTERTDVTVTIYDIDTPDGRVAASKYNVMSLPSIFISSPRGRKGFIGSHVSEADINRAIVELTY